MLNTFGIVMINSIRDFYLGLLKMFEMFAPEVDVNGDEKEMNDEDSCVTDWGHCQVTGG